MVDIQDVILGLGADTPIPGLASLTPALLLPGFSPPLVPLTPPGYSKCILVAHDWGAVLAWNFSIYYPSLVERMVVVSAAPMSVYQGVLGSPGRWNMPVWRGLSLCPHFLVHQSTPPPPPRGAGDTHDAPNLQSVTVHSGVTHGF